MLKLFTFFLRQNFFFHRDRYLGKKFIAYLHSLELQIYTSLNFIYYQIYLLNKINNRYLKSKIFIAYPYSSELQIHTSLTFIYCQIYLLNKIRKYWHIVQKHPIPILDDWVMRRRVYKFMQPTFKRYSDAINYLLLACSHAISLVYAK